MITAKHIDQHGKVALWEATDDGHRQVMLASVDAAHALQADPDRWSLPDEPGAPPSVKKTEERSASEYGGEAAR